MILKSTSRPKSQRSERHKDRLPPEWVWWRVGLVLVGEALVYGPGLLLTAVCLNLIFKNPLGLECACWIYLPGVLFLIGLYMVRLLRHPFRVHEERLVDRTEAEALFDGGRYAIEENRKLYPDNEEHKALSELIECRLSQGPSTWTEYRILPVEQGVVRLLPINDLIARAYVRLDDLKEYNEKKTDAEKEYFSTREERLHTSIEKAKRSISPDNQEKLQEATHTISAELRMLLETLADYDKNWAIGSEILRALLIAISFTVPIFLLMGVAPVLMPQPGNLSFYSWALFGTAGSLTAVLRKLYLYNKVEVGDSEGKNELYQAIKGAILGLVSAVLIYTMLWGQLVPAGPIVPDVTLPDLKNINLSVFWAFMTGFAFESFFDRAQREQIVQQNL